MKATLCRTPFAIPLVLILALASAAALLAATGGITIYVDGRVVPANAVVIEGRTYLPVRAVGEALGCTVQWHSATKSVHITQAGQAVAYGAATQPAPAPAPEPRTYSAATRDVGTAGASALSTRQEPGASITALAAAPSQSPTSP